MTDDELIICLIVTVIGTLVVIIWNALRHSNSPQNRFITVGKVLSRSECLVEGIMEYEIKVEYVDSLGDTYTKIFRTKNRETAYSDEVELAILSSDFLKRHRPDEVPDVSPDDFDSHKWYESAKKIRDMSNRMAQRDADNKLSNMLFHPSRYAENAVLNEENEFDSKPFLKSLKKEIFIFLLFVILAIAILFLIVFTSGMYLD